MFDTYEEFKQYEKERMCLSKRRYRRRKDANEVLVQMRKSGRTTKFLQIYKCLHGNHFHIGNNNRKKRRKNK